MNRAAEVGRVDGRGSVLLVDDDAILAGALSRALAANDHLVEVAWRLDSALERLSDGVYTAIVTDLDLGAGAVDGGSAILRAAQVQQPQARRVLMTGRSEVSLEIRRLAHVFLAKPFPLGALSDALFPASRVATHRV